MKQEKTVGNTRKELDEKIKSGSVTGIFFFYGDEDYMVDFYLNKLKSACVADKPDNIFGDGFDTVRFTDADFSPDALYTAMLACPVEAKYKFIEVRDVNLSKSAGDKKVWNSIFNLDSPPRGYCDCCVVFTKKGSDLKGDSAMGAIAKSAFTVEFALNDTERLAKWLKKIFAASKIEIPAQNISYMLSFGIRDMYGLKNEADKLINYKLYQNEPEVSKADIDLIVCKTNEIQAFELANAVLDGKFEQAVSILKKLEFLREEPVTVAAQIGRVFCDLKVLAEVKDAYYSDPKLIAKQIKMHEYKIKLYLAALGRINRTQYRNADFVVKAVELAAECDITLKSLYLDGYIVLCNLIYNLWTLRTQI